MSDRMKRLWGAAMLTMAIGSSAVAQEGLRRGDLLFFSDKKGMGKAVSESTGEYTHVAMVESVRGDTVWIIDANRRYGVSRRELPDDERVADVYRLTVAFDTAKTMSRAMSYVGQAYDNAFMPENGAMYCSELIYESYRDWDGNRLFHSRPMNWRDKRGRMPRYWKRHFARMGMEVPEGVEGTNPTDLSREKLLKRVAAETER